MILAGAPLELEMFLNCYDANLGKVLARSEHIPAQLYRYQAMALYILARPYDRHHILEIGTGAGYSTSIIAQACPRSQIVTLNPRHSEATIAAENLQPWPNVTIVEKKSWDYVPINRQAFGFIFVDGDHRNVHRDLIWYARLQPNGLILFHDYDEKRSPSAHSTLNQAVSQFGPFDVFIMDTNEAGMVGWRQRR